MKLLSMARTELRFIASMGLTPVLVMLYPILIMLILGPAFSSSVLGTANLSVAVYSEDAAALSNIQQAVSGVGGLAALPARSLDDLVLMIKSGRAPLGLVIVNDANGTRADFYRDPSKGFIATNMMVSIQSALNEKKGAAVADTAARIRQDVASSSRFLRASVDDIASMREELSDLQANLTSLDSRAAALQDEGQSQMLSDMRTRASAARGQVQELRSVLSDIQSESYELGNLVSNIDRADARLVSLYYALDDFDSKRTSYNAKINSAISRLNKYDSDLAQAQYAVRSARSSTSDPDLRAQLDAIEAPITNARADIAATRSDLYSAQADLNAVDTNSYRAEITNTRYQLSDARSELVSIQGRVDSGVSKWAARADTADRQLQEADAKIGDLGRSLELLESFLSDLRDADMAFTQRSRYWLSDIGRIQSDSGGVLSTLDRLSGSADAKYLGPMRVGTQEVIANTNTLNVFFPAIVGVDMVLASLLLPMIVAVGLRNQGMDQRIRDSRMGSLNFVLGRFIGNYLVSLLQLLLLITVAFLFFGVGQVRDWGAALAVALLVPAVFTALGLFLSHFIHKESTAVLVSLVVSIPNIFLASGIIPIEFLPLAFQYLGKAMPLYHATSAVSSVAMRGLGAPDIFFNALYMVLFTLFFLLVTYILRKWQE